MDPLERYRQYRTVGKDLNARITENYLDRATVTESAALLGLLDEQGRVSYETEMDMTVHQEFLLHEAREAGSTPVERFHADALWQSEVEKEVVAGMRRSFTALFSVTSVEAEKRWLILRDVLNDDTGIELVDIGLSQTVEPGVLLFFRLVPFESFNMTAGVVLPFSRTLEDHLRGVHDRVSGQVTSRPAAVTRYVSFYKLFKKYGSEVQSLETPLPSGALGPSASGPR